MAETAHVHEGTLRRIHDEPLCATLEEREHLDACARCQEASSRVRDDAERVGALLAQERVEPDVTAALRAVRARLDQAPGRLGVLGRRRAGRAFSGWTARRWRRTPLVAAGVAVAFVAGTAGAAAAGWLTIFEARQVHGVAIAPADLSGLPDLSAFGRVTGIRGAAPHQVPTVADAERESGLHLSIPQQLPAGVSRDAVTYLVVDHSTGSFTFEAQQAARWAADHGQALPSMPRGLDGSTIGVEVGPGMAAIYGGDVPLPAGGRSGEGRDDQALPALVIGAVHAPAVHSSGAGLGTIEDYLLHLPGVPPSLAAQIRAIGDPASTLPIPIPAVNGHDVVVQGVHGVAVGDETGVGSILIWERGSVVYGAAGSLPLSRLVALADALR
jgi:hypothetical protein